LKESGTKGREKEENRDVARGGGAVEKAA